MKKNLIALAILGAFSGAALAQSNVTLYGIIDVGFQVQRSGVSGQRLPAASTLVMQSGNRWGIRGSEALQPKPERGVHASKVALTSIPAPWLRRAACRDHASDTTAKFRVCSGGARPVYSVARRGAVYRAIGEPWSRGVLRPSRRAPVPLT